MGTLIGMVIAVVAVGVITIVIVTVMAHAHTGVRPDFRQGNGTRLNDHPRYGPIHRSMRESGELDLRQRHDAMYTQVNQHHARRKKSKFKWLRRETDESIEADRLREVRQLGIRLRLAGDKSPGKQSKAMLGKIHPKTGENHTYGITRPGHGVRPPTEKKPVIPRRNPKNGGNKK